MVSFEDPIIPSYYQVFDRWRSILIVFQTSDRSFDSLYLTYVHSWPTNRSYRMVMRCSPRSETTPIIPGPRAEFKVKP